MKSHALAPRAWFSKCLDRTRRTMLQRNTPRVGRIDFGELRQNPSFTCGVDHSNGQALDEYYIAQFLHREVRLLKGNVLEVGNYRVLEFAGSRMAKITSVPFAEDTQLINDLAALKDNTYDTLVMGHVLQFIYDLDAVVKQARRILIPGGIFLATMPGSCYVPKHVNGQRPYWGFTDLSVRTLLESTFPARSINVQSFGNVFVATAHVQHLAARDLTHKELNHRDKHYPFVLALKAESSAHS